jgi:UDPglucose 6-dehydrogenase
MKLLVIGDDHAAWTMASVLASSGCHCIICKDNITPADINEPGLNRLSSDQIRQGRLQLLEDSIPAIDTDLMLYAEPHASYEELLACSIDYAEKAKTSCQSNDQPSKRVVALIQPFEIGTTDRLQQDLKEQGHDFVSVVFWPSFIQSGRAIESFSYAERVLLGSSDEHATGIIRQIMSPYNRSRDTFMVMKPKEAELTKVAINGMLATRVSFMNELADYASVNEIDIEPVRQGIGSDSRIGFQYLYPGCGFGGQAFLDTLHQLTKELEAHQHSSLLKSVWQRNEQQKDMLFQKFWRFYQADIQGKSVAIWGGAFKPNTASISGSPAIGLIESLLAHKVTIRLYDPAANRAMLEYFSGDAGIVACQSAYQAAENSDALMLVTEWKEFWNLDLAQVAGKMRQPLLLDGRNIYDPDYALASGVIYSGVGRGQKI